MTSKKSLILSLSVLALLSAAGCGKSKDEKSIGLPGQTTGPNDGTELDRGTGTRTGRGTPSDTSTNPGDDAGNDSGTETGTNTGTVTATDNPPTFIPEVPAGNMNGNDGTVLPPLPSAPVGNCQGGASDTENHTGNSDVIKPPLATASQVTKPGAEAVKFNEAEAIKTGGKVDDLYYTSAGNDGLMKAFRDLNAKETADQRKANADLAKSIVTAKVSRVVGTNEINVILKMSESGKVVEYTLHGVEKNQKFDLTKISGIGAFAFEGGFLKCTDADGGCENSYIKIKSGKAVARIIFRQSYMNRYFVYPDYVTNKSLSMWKDYILNSVLDLNTTKKIDYVQASSFEVVNGRSGMGVLMLTQDKQLVGLSIPLFAPAKGTALSSQVVKLSSVVENFNLRPLSGAYTEELGAAVNDVKLINNNGKGDLRMTFDLTEGGVAASITVVLSKVEKKTLSLNQVASFEKSLK